MVSVTRVPIGGRDNALGFVRLVLAALVIVSHTPEMVDGNRVREPLSSIFQTISFGEFAVDSFFVISGYLIVASYQQSGSTTLYLKKRVARIFPGFAAATVLTLAIAAPLAGGDMHYVATHIPRYIGKIVTLQHVNIPGVLAGMPIPAINEAVWTISYEFRCYLIVIILGAVGLLDRPVVLACGGLLLMALFINIPVEQLRIYSHYLPAYHIWLGELDQLLRLIGLFLIGSLFYLWRSELEYSWKYASVAFFGMLISLSFSSLAELGTAMFGGYLVFGFAAWGKNTIFVSINNKTDISYGVYLYGWPIGALAIYYLPYWSITALTLLTIALAMVFGWLSWVLIEKPGLRLLAREYGMRSVHLPRIKGRFSQLRRR